MQDIEQANLEIIQSKNEVIAEKDKELEYIVNNTGMASNYGKQVTPNLKVPLTVNLDSRIGFQTDFNRSENHQDFFDDDKKSREAQSIGGVPLKEKELYLKPSLDIKIDFDK